MYKFRYLNVDFHQSPDSVPPPVAPKPTIYRSKLPAHSLVPPLSYTNPYVVTVCSGIVFFLAWIFSVACVYLCMLQFLSILRYRVGGMHPSGSSLILLSITGVPFKLTESHRLSLRTSSITPFFLSSQIPMLASLRTVRFGGQEPWYPTSKTAIEHTAQGLAHD